MTPTSLDHKRGRFEQESSVNFFPGLGAPSQAGEVNLNSNGNLEFVDFMDLFSSVASPSNPNPTKATTLEGRASALSKKEETGYDLRLEEMGRPASAQLKEQQKRDNFSLDDMDVEMLNEFSFLLDVMDPTHSLSEAQRSAMERESISKLQLISQRLNERDQKGK